MYYDRKIKYFYLYDKGEKVQNAGFVRLEARGDKVNLQLRVEKLHQTDAGKVQVILLSEKKEAVLGDVVLEQGRGTLECIDLPLENMADRIGYHALWEIVMRLPGQRELKCIVKERQNEVEASQSLTVALQTPAAGRERMRAEAFVFQAPMSEPGNMSEQMPPMVPLPEYEPQPKQEAQPEYEPQPKQEPQSEDEPKPACELRAKFELQQEPESLRMYEPGRVFAGQSDDKTQSEHKIKSKYELQSEYVQPSNHEPRREYAWRSEYEPRPKMPQEKMTKEICIEQMQENVLQEMGESVNIPNEQPKQKQTGWKIDSYRIGNPLQEQGMKKIGDTEPGPILRPIPIPPRGERQNATTKWQQLSNIYPHIRPFEDGRDYLKIKPEDFVILTQKYYPLVTNSFLKHGYYNYGHLILTREMHKDGEHFYIGVPGSFYEKEKQVAVLFGFESFEGKSEPAKNGDFGYYMISVEI